MKTKEFIKYSQEQGVTDIQITSKRAYQHSISIINQEIDTNEIDDTTKYMIKATYQDKTITLSTEVLKKDLINIIKEKSKYLERPKEPIIEDISRNNEEKNIEPINLTSMINNILKFHKLKKQYPLVANIQTNLSYELNEIIIENQKGLHIKTSNESSHLYIETLASLNDKNICRTYRETKKSMEEYNFEEKYHTILKESEEELNKQVIESKKYNIIFKNNATAKLIGYIVDMLSAESINKNLSILKDKLNKQVFSKNITLIEEPQNRDFPGYRYFDDEGVITIKKELVKDGILKTYLYDQKNAILNNINSTGNSYNDSVSVRNYYLKPGENSFDELTKKLKNGIVIENLTGNVSGVNPSNGNFSFQISGYIIENGLKKNYIEPCILSSSISEIFNKVLEVGNDLHFVTSTMASPSILVEKIEIIGKK